jgi:hypothetical protein
MTCIYLCMYGLWMIVYPLTRPRNPSNQLLRIVLNIRHYRKMNVMDEMYPIMD